MPEFELEAFREPEWMKEIFKGFRGLDRLSEEGKGEMLKWYEDVRAFQNSLEICLWELKSSVVWSEVLAEMYNAVTGLNISGKEVNLAGERITNLERAFNIREGLTRRDDTLPDRFLKEPTRSGTSKGQVVELDTMIDEYYECRGWDKESGFPGRDKLEELDLKDIANDLEKMGRLGKSKKG
jgi:aldehyde:ferredoxin oxidoreductase